MSINKKISENLFHLCIWDIYTTSFKSDNSAILVIWLVNAFLCFCKWERTHSLNLQNKSFIKQSRIQKGFSCFMAKFIILVIGRGASKCKRRKWQNMTGTQEVGGGVGSKYEIFFFDWSGLGILILSLNFQISLFLLKHTSLFKHASCFEMGW